MHLYFEKNNNAKCDCNILSLSWMGKVPDESPEVRDLLFQRFRVFYSVNWI